MDRAVQGAGSADAPRASRADSFDDVFGSAIARAVRRAVDGVGRDPIEPEPAPAPAPDEPTDAGPPPLPPQGTSDPYELLGVGRRAAWSDITAAYKRRARAWHPDGAPADEQERRHELLRDLNGAYAELRVRRGR